ncbi:MAG: hypothetical protein HN736_17490 [Anaerolineae bacterium]|jgi:M6 family metalloprotease-like protein|nr:hypothetical protein [Anaerolineae bacterium]MBT4309813.1 hypothetical protein [Anaerolineae bacterium]MBT4457401.1 hypothetical protein [Anaerolineae bacterium]MBT4843055.1 hypothetical protein [Anaerolineae bacterium]MBT6061559.1 hypothetical protein [Anaerolineae bacterium]
MKNFKCTYSILFFIVITLSFLVSNSTFAATFSSTDTNQIISKTGWLTIIWGDAPDGSPATDPLYFLTDENEQRNQLLVDENLGGLLSFDRQRVTLHGTQELSSQSGENIIQVESIELADLQSQNLGALTSGSQPFISVMCKFPEVATDLKSLVYFQDMYGNTYPGLGHYWKEASYNIIDVLGSDASGWHTLPHTKTYYNPSNTLGGADLNALASDCLAAADPSVNFASYTGINMMFNANFDNGYAWGGGRYMTLDGVTKVWPITWEPPWGYSSITVISHEMGHAFGLPHSSGDYGATYDNEWDVMSDAWANCSYHVTYGCLGQHTISYHRDKLGWISAGEKYTVNDKSYATITLEQLTQPQTNNYKMAKIPINDSSSNYYTVEVRRQVGYDVKLPGQAVIIHEVNTGRSRPAYVIDADGNGDTGDAGAMWLTGETFVDATNNIKVTVDSASATGFQVTIQNDAILTPENFQVTNTEQYSISLAWDDIVGERGYKIYRKEGVDFVQIDSVGANTTVYIDEDVRCNTSYEYKLSAYDAVNESPLTNALTTATLSSCPAVPSNDDFDFPISLSSPSTTPKLDTREATEHAHDPDLSGCGITGTGYTTVWYSYEQNTGSDTFISIDTKDPLTDYDTFIAVWTGTREDLTLVACNDNISDVVTQSQLAFRVQSGIPYYIEIGQP